VDIKELTNQAITGNYETHGKISDGNCVIGFSFGFQQEGELIHPGLSNQDIAKFITDTFSNKPLILQFEIMDALKANGQNIFRISKHREAEKYLDTSEVAKQAQIIMANNLWDKAIIVAHPFHMPRVYAVCKKVGLDTIVPSGLESIRFDPNSAQEWTRNKDAWANRESEAIKLSLEMGLI
jgi:hypothetical protein